MRIPTNLLILILLLIVMSCDNNDGSSTATEEPQNNPPIISDLYYTTPIEQNDVAQLTCIAEDPDGDILTYSWTAMSGGEIIQQLGNSAIWEPPAGIRLSISYQIGVFVYDTDGYNDSDIANIIVFGEVQEETLISVYADGVDETFPDTDLTNFAMSVGYSLAGADAARLYAVFDFTSLNDQTNVDIINATLKMYCMGIVNPGHDQYTIHFTEMQNWPSPFTWNTQPSYDSEVFATQTVNTYGFGYWNIDELVEKVVDELPLSTASEYYGLCVRNDNPYGTYASFDVQQNAQKPRVILQYQFK